MRSGLQRFLCYKAQASNSRLRRRMSPKEAQKCLFPQRVWMAAEERRIGKFSDINSCQQFGIVRSAFVVGHTLKAFKEVTAALHSALNDAVDTRSG